MIELELCVQTHPTGRGHAAWDNLVNLSYIVEDTPENRALVEKIEANFKADLVNRLQRWKANNPKVDPDGPHGCHNTETDEYSGDEFVGRCHIWISTTPDGEAEDVVESLLKPLAHSPETFRERCNALAAEHA